MWTSTRRRDRRAHVDVCGQREGSKKSDFCGRHKWMTPKTAVLKTAADASWWDSASDLAWPMTSYRCNRPEYTPGQSIPGYSVASVNLYPGEYFWPRPIHTPSGHNIPWDINLPRP